MLRVCKSVILKKMLILLSLGNGPLLGVYSAAKGVLLIEKCLLQGSRIHGIRGTLYIQVVNLQGSTLVFQDVLKIMRIYEICWSDRKNLSMFKTIASYHGKCLKNFTLVLTWRICSKILTSLVEDPFLYSHDLIE